MRRILAIDGGGIRGILPAAFLAEIEQDIDQPLHRYFDLIVGCSTGGILAIGLALGLSAKDLLSIYVDRCPHVFGQIERRGWLATKLNNLMLQLKHLSQPKHDADDLRFELELVLNQARIGDAKTRILIPTWDADQRRPYIYKTAHHPRLSTDYKKPAIDAAMATSAAPTYFKRHNNIDKTGLLDGGVWANNPVGIAVVEATTLLGWSPDSLRVLSLGCTEEVYMLEEAPGVIGLGSDVLKLLMDGQSCGALNMAKLITGHTQERKAIYRCSPSVPEDYFNLDDTGKLDRLKGLGTSSARQMKPALAPVFLQSTVNPFVPVYDLEGLAA